MNPVLIQVGPFQVHWYGLLIVMGALLAAWLSTKEAARRGEDPEQVWNLLTWALIFGILGARLYHVFSTPTGNFAGWAYYREHPLDIIKFWDGGFRGLGIYGAVAGGVLAVVVFARAHHLNLPRWLDIPTPGLLVAQAIGRMGNRVNQELYGPPANVPWAFHINPNYPCQEPAGSPMACGLPDRLDATARDWYATHGFHPTFYYEAIWNLVGFALLWTIGRRFKSWLRDGDIFLMYMIWYPVGRFWVETFRPDAWRIGSLATAQWIAIGSIVIGVAGLVLNHVRARHQPPAEVVAEEPVVPAGAEEQTQASELS
jgi:phosphatidylglycerol---prolipoprotein diacylglyceryl transferase